MTSKESCDQLPAGFNTTLLRLHQQQQQQDVYLQSRRNQSPLRNTTHSIMGCSASSNTGEDNNSASSTQLLSDASGRISLVEAARLAQHSSAFKPNLPSLVPPPRLSAGDQRARLSGIIEDVLDILNEDEDETFFQGPSCRLSVPSSSQQDAATTWSSRTSFSLGRTRRAPDEGSSSSRGRRYYRSDRD